jgi:hypothetical protein
MAVCVRGISGSGRTYRRTRGSSMRTPQGHDTSELTDELHGTTGDRRLTFETAVREKKLQVIANYTLSRRRREPPRSLHVAALRLRRKDCNVPAVTHRDESGNVVVAPCSQRDAPREPRPQPAGAAPYDATPPLQALCGVHLSLFVVTLTAAAVFTFTVGLPYSSSARFNIKCRTPTLLLHARGSRSHCRMVCADFALQAGLRVFGRSSRDQGSWSENLTKSAGGRGSRRQLASSQRRLRPGRSRNDLVSAQLQLSARREFDLFLVSLSGPGRPGPFSFGAFEADSAVAGIFERGLSCIPRVRKSRFFELGVRNHGFIHFSRLAVRHA